MSRINLYIVGELREHAETLDNHKHRAAIEIGASYGALEQRVACERHLLSLTIECQAALRMTGSLKDCECMTTEGDGVASIQALPCIGEVISCEIVNTANALGLLGSGLEHGLIGGAYLRAQPPVVENKLITEVMIHMSVGDNKVLRL